MLPDPVHELPETLALVALRVACTHGERFAEDLHLGGGVRDEVLVPAGMLRSSALRRHDHRVVAVHAVDERRRRLVTGLATGRRQQQDRRALAPDVPFLAVRLPVAANVFLTE